MPESDLRSLRTLPEALQEADEVLAVLDDAFVCGFGRLGSAQLAALSSFQRSFAHTPLAGPLAEAVDGIGRAEFIDRHFQVLGAARAAVQGAMHDALLAQACAALGRPLPQIDEVAAAPVQKTPQAEVLQESIRHWLMELAIAGFANLGVELLLPFQATLDAVLVEPALARHAALLSGFLDELMTVFPAHGTPEIPRLRWSDLWTRAMVLCSGAPEPPPSRPVSGELRILGTDLRQHDHLATLVVYGSLRQAGAEPRLVRAHVSAFKVDVIQGAELGALLGDVGKTLIAALGERLHLTLKDMPLSSTGDLIWDDARAKLAGKAILGDEAAAVLPAAPAQRPCLLPADRHPALIDELVYLPATAYTPQAPLPLDLLRMPTGPDLLPADLPGSSGLVALLRYDAGAWSLQPAAVLRGKANARLCGTGLLDGQKKSGRGTSLSTLKERAGKLLRKKS